MQSVKLTPSGAPLISSSNAMLDSARLGDARQDNALMLDQVDLEHILQDRPVVLQGKASAALFRQQMVNNIQQDLPSTTPADLPRSSSPTQLSPTAQLIGQALHKAEALQAPPQLQGQTPLQNSPHIDTPKLAHNLHQALEKSGLFYESHLKEWSRGERSLEQIQQEPQNQKETGSTTAAQLVPLQLDTLEQRRIVWQGELLPGQNMYWEIQEDRSKRQSPSSAQSGEDERSSWQSVLKLQFPELGTINANIRLDNGRVQLLLRVVNPNSASSLQNAQEQLTQALAAAGNPLDSFGVRNDDGSPKT